MVQAVVLQAQSSNTGAITIGTIETIYSEVLDEDRIVYIHVPTGYDQMVNIPLVIVLDADSQFNQTVSTISYISNGTQGNDLVPPSIVVGITSPNRNYDFTPVQGLVGLDSTSISNTGGASKFLSFITDELIPYIDGSYSTCSHRTIIGHSLGGLFVFHALLEKAEYFDNYLVIDPAIGFADGVYLEEVLNQFKKTELHSENMYYASAVNRPSGMRDEELRKTSFQFLQNIDKSHLVFREHKESERWNINLKTVHDPQENHYSIPFRATYDAFRYFYDYYQFKEMNELFYSASSHFEINLVNKLKQHYSIISKSIGCEIKPQLGYLNSWAWGYGEDTRTRPTAHDMFLYNIELYPELSEPYTNYGYFLYSKEKYSQAINQYDKALELEMNESLLDFRNEIAKEMTRSNK